MTRVRRPAGFSFLVTVWSPFLGRLTDAFACVPYVSMTETTATDRTEKAREARLRRLAASQGLRLQKLRSGRHAGGYVLSDPNTNALVYGGDYSIGGTLDLDDIEQWLNG